MTIPVESLSAEELLKELDCLILGATMGDWEANYRPELLRRLAQPGSTPERVIENQRATAGSWWKVRAATDDSLPSDENERRAEDAERERDEARAQIQQAVQQERERCAQIALNYAALQSTGEFDHDRGWDNAARYIAAAITSEGPAKGETAE